MNKAISIIYKNSEQKKYLINALLLVYAFLGSAGTILSFASCFRFGKNIWFYLFPILISVCFCSVFLSDRMYKAAFVAICGGAGIYSLTKWKQMAGGFITTANIVIADANESYQMGWDFLSYPQKLRLYKENDLFLIVMTVLITVLICFFIVGYASAFGCILVSMPFTIFGIFFDLFPKVPYLVMAVTFWIVAAALRASGWKGRRRPDVAIYNALFLAVFVGIIFLISQKAIPEERYQKNEQLLEVRNVLDRLAEKFSSVALEGIGTGEDEPGMRRGEFGYQDEIRFTGHTMLEVRVPLLSENIYLKCKEYNEYTGNQWNDNAKWFQSYFEDDYLKKDRGEWPQNTTSSLLKGSDEMLGFYEITVEDYCEMVKEYEITVDNLNDLEYGFIPYGAVIEGHSLERDVIPDLKGMKHYQFQVYAGDVDEVLDKIDSQKVINYWEEATNQNWEHGNWFRMAELYSLAEAEKNYASFVRKAYTQVPSELESILRQYAPAVVEYRYDETMEFVQEIRRMFLEEYTYTLAPGKVPEGMDGVEYFLTENKRGYCVYFASAATLIFRMAGIPSRYVEGYVVTPDMAKINRRENVSVQRKISGEMVEEEINYVTVTVPDNKAHAWVEIYIAGYGWIPVEVTPGYYSAREITSGNEENDTEEETTTDREIETESQSKKQEKEEDLKKEKDFDWKGLGRMLLALVIAGGGITVFVIAIQRWYRSGKEKYLAIVEEQRGVDAKKRACLAWWYMESVMKFLGRPMPENISYEELKEFLKENTEFFSKRDFNGTIDYIIKTYYGNESLTREEMDEIAEMIREFRKEVYESLSKGRQWRFKYIKRL